MFSNVRYSEDGLTLAVTWKDTYLFFLNSMMRIIKSEIPNIAIDEVKVLENTTLFYDDLLQHKITHLPVQSLRSPNSVLSPKSVCSCPYGNCSKCTLNLELMVENKSLEDRKVVFSHDFYSHPQGEGQAHIRMIPNLPLLELNPGQKVHIQAKARNSIVGPETNAHFAVACKATWPSSKKEEEDADEQWRQRNSNSKPFITDIFIESIGQQPPQKILLAAFEVMSGKIESMLTFLSV